MPPQKEQREPHSIQKKKKKTRLTTEEERRRKERQSIFGYIALFVLVSTVVYGLTEEDLKNKKVDASTSSPVDYYDQGSSFLPFGQNNVFEEHKNNIVIPPLPPSELESLWEAIEIDRGFSPSKRDRPFDLLTKEEQRKEIEADLNTLSDPYESDIKINKNAKRMKVKCKVLINHEKKFVIFEKVKDLHQKVRIYFKNGNSSLVLPNGLAENLIFEKIAKYHIDSLKYVSKDNPYYQGTRDLYSKYLTKDVINADYTDGRTLYKTPANIGFDIDTKLKPHIESDKDKALSELYGRQYNTLDDLVLRNSDPLQNGDLDRKLCEEYYFPHFARDSRFSLRNVLNGKGISGEERGINLFQKAILKAIENRLLSETHLVALLRYGVCEGYYNLNDLDYFLKNRKYFHVVYRDLLRRILILNESDNFRFPNLGEICGEISSSGKIHLYRGLKGQFYFDIFEPIGMYIESSSLNEEVANIYTKQCKDMPAQDGIFLKLEIPLTTQKIIDLSFNNSFGNEFLLTKGCPYKVVAFYVK